MRPSPEAGHLSSLKRHLWVAAAPWQPPPQAREPRGPASSRHPEVALGLWTRLPSVSSTSDLRLAQQKRVSVWRTRSRTLIPKQTQSPGLRSGQRRVRGWQCGAPLGPAGSLPVRPRSRQRGAGGGAAGWVRWDGPPEHPVARLGTPSESRGDRPRPGPFKGTRSQSLHLPSQRIFPAALRQKNLEK